MSHSPTKEVSSQTAINYVSGLNELVRLVESGMSHSGNERNCCFLNTADGRFADMSVISGLDFVDDGRTVAPVDWDGDGDLDLWLASRTGPQVRLMLNKMGDGQDFVAFRLKGSTVNRDGIGARVTVRLKGSDQPLVQTLHAGNSFLSQGSKWLHFGLGAGQHIENVTVRWPNGKQERFAGAIAGQRYRLVQGAGKCKAVASKHQQVDLRPTRLNEAPSSQHARVFLASRPLLPNLEYENMLGRTSAVRFDGGKPLLVNVWATWCAPCVEELAELKDRFKELSERELNVLALSVDGLDERGGNAAAVRQFATRQKLPFEVGLAKAESIDKLELLLRKLFGRHQPMPVPTSLLVDKDGRVAALYFGAIEVNKLLEDLAHLNDNHQQRRAWGDRFKGRWFTPPQRFSADGLAEAYLRAGYAEDAVAVLQESLRVDDGNVGLHNLMGAALMAKGDDTQAEAHYRKALAGNRSYVRARYNLGLLLSARGKVDEAITLFRQVLEIAPDYADAQFSLGHALESQHDWRGAEAAYREALRIDPQYLAARNGLGVVLARRGEDALATREFRTVLKRDPANRAAHHNMGLVHLGQHQAAQAIEHLQQALVGEGEKADVRNSLGVALASQGKLDQAIEQYRAAIKEKADDANIHYNLAAALEQQRAEADAVKHYRRAYELAPQRPLMANGLAWLLATARNAELRAPAEAVRLAELAADATNSAMPEILDTLGAAYAAAGRWKKAEAVTVKAIALSRSLNKPDLAQEMEERLTLYRKQQAFVQP